MPRSVGVREDCIARVRSAVIRQGYITQALLVEAMDGRISQSTVSNFLNGKRVDFRYFIDICHFLNIDPWQSVADLERDFTSPNTRKLFISYGSASDQSLVQALSQALGNTCQVQSATYTTKKLKSGQPIQKAIAQCDYFILCLSSLSATSDVVVEVLKQVTQLSTSRPDPKPMILPILIHISRSDLGYELNQYLGSMICWEWKALADTEQFVQTLLKIIPNGQLPQALPNSPVKAEIGQPWLNPPPNPNAPPELPEGQVAIASQFYIERPPIESRCYEEIQKLGALIRIKAPRQMGKTSLMTRIVKQAEQHGDQTAILDLQSASEQTLRDSDRFLKWFCVGVGHALNLSLEPLREQWDLEFADSNTLFRMYFERTLLPQLSAPLTIALDEVDRVFAYPEVFQDFFGLLRSLHEEAKRRAIWSKLRLIIVHSTEVYVPMDINQSPFNVGLAIELPEFTPEQIQTLAHRHQLEWDLSDSEKLMSLIGGHPFLTRLALYHIAQKDCTLASILQTGINPDGLFGDHLYRCELILEQYPELSEAMRRVIDAGQPVLLPPPVRFKLKSMGLVKLNSEGAVPRSRLYHDYFRNV